MEEILADSDSDLEDDSKQHDRKETRKALRQRGQAWLKEGEGDEPLNFLDPHVAHRVLGKDQPVNSDCWRLFSAPLLGGKMKMTCIAVGKGQAGCSAST